MRPAHGKWVQNALQGPTPELPKCLAGQVRTPNHGQRSFVQAFLSPLRPFCCSFAGSALAWYDRCARPNQLPRGAIVQDGPMSLSADYKFKTRDTNFLQEKPHLVADVKMAIGYLV